MKPVLAVVGASARLLTQVAVAEGWDVYALDLFGDADTRALALGWWSVGPAQGGDGSPGCLQIDPAALRAGLEAALACARASGRDLLGWLPGAPLEGAADTLAWLAQQLPQLPLLGCAPAALRGLRDPHHFFAALAAAGLPHPAVARERPPDGQAWLLKDLRGCGGSHIRLLPAAQPVPALAAGQYLQRRAPGQPMSATFVTDGCEAQVLGFNRQIVRADAGLPYRFCGVVGPVPVPGAVAQGLQQACDELVRIYGPQGLRGLCSLDFLLQGDDWQLLELNPRPPASTALYALWRPLQRHLQACGVQPPAGPQATADPAGPVDPALAVHGWEIVYPRRPLTLSTEDARWLALQPATHDLPWAGQHFVPGQPLCSVSASAASLQQVLQQLTTRRETLLNHLETCPA